MSGKIHSAKGLAAALWFRLHSEAKQAEVVCLTTWPLASALLSLISVNTRELLWRSASFSQSYNVGYQRRGSSAYLVEDHTHASHDKPIERNHDSGDNKEMLAISIGLEKRLVDVISHLQKLSLQCMCLQVCRNTKSHIADYAMAQGRLTQKRGRLKRRTGYTRELMATISADPEDLQAQHFWACFARYAFQKLAEHWHLSELLMSTGQSDAVGDALRDCHQNNEYYHDGTSFAQECHSCSGGHETYKNAGQNQHCTAW